MIEVFERGKPWTNAGLRLDDPRTYHLIWMRRIYGRSVPAGDGHYMDVSVFRDNPQAAFSFSFKASVIREKGRWRTASILNPVFGKIDMRSGAVSMEPRYLAELAINEFNMLEAMAVRVAELVERAR